MEICYFDLLPKELLLIIIQWLIKSSWTNIPQELTNRLTDNDYQLLLYEMLPNYNQIKKLPIGINNWKIFFEFLYKFTYPPPEEFFIIKNEKLEKPIVDRCVGICGRLYTIVNVINDDNGLPKSFNAISIGGLIVSIKRKNGWAIFNEYGGRTYNKIISIFGYPKLYSSDAPKLIIPIVGMKFSSGNYKYIIIDVIWKDNMPIKASIKYIGWSRPKDGRYILEIIPSPNLDEWIIDGLGGLKWEGYKL